MGMAEIDDELLSIQAVDWVKKNQKELVSKIIGQYNSAPVVPVSIFMAGSPGAGKTEFSKNFIKQFKDHEKYIVRIDPDEIREMLPQYCTGKAHLFQTAVSIAVEKIHDHVLKKSKSFLLDGTFSNFDVAQSNVRRSVDKGRIVLIQYVYQDPLVAWDFTKKREVIEGRNIPKESFIEQFFAARKNVEKIKSEFGEKVKVDLIERNIKTNKYTYKDNIDSIDNYIKDKYNSNNLISLLP